MTDPTPEDKAVALAEKYFLKSAKDYKDGAYYCDNADVIAMLADHEQQVREAIATMQTQNEEHLKDKVALRMALEQETDAATRYFHQLGVCEKRRQEAEARVEQLETALRMGYEDTMDYIKRNHLSGAENNHWLVLARAAMKESGK